MSIGEGDTGIKDECINCGRLIKLNSRFCKFCGAKQTTAEATFEPDKWAISKQCALFFSVNILACALAKFVDVFDSLPWQFFFEAILCATSVCFFVLNRAENKTLLTWHNFSFTKLAAYGALAMSAALIVHYLADWVNIVLFKKEDYYALFFKGSFYYAFVLIIFDAVIPAFFEEMGFRGYLLTSLSKISDKQQAVYISAFLFGIIHLSFISLIWLLPFALFLGYIRVKENTLWYGIYFHFLFNLTACLFKLI